MDRKEVHVSVHVYSREWNTPDEIKVFNECQVQLLFHDMHDGLNGHVLVVIDECHVMCTIEVHP